MTISQRGSNTPLGDDAPLGGNTSVGDQFNRFEVGIGTPADELGNPKSEIGIGAPADDMGTPGILIGITAPTITDVVPAGDVPAGDAPAGDAPAGDAPASDNLSSGEAGDSLAGLGTWESVIQLEVAGEDDEPYQKGGGGFDPRAANTPGSPGQLLTLGTNPDGSHFFSGNRNVDATLIGSKWGTLNLTYSFPSAGSNYNGPTFDSNGVSNYHNVLGTVAQAAARAAFAQLSAYTGLTFTEITDTDSVHANIRISQTADADVPSAYGNFPSDYKAVAGDIWFGKNNQPYYDLAIKGTWGFSTMMHEIGHTMGLKHGHQDYTNSDISAFFGTFPRFGSQSLTPDRDGQAWSLMTYTPAPFTNSNFAGDKISQPQSYMQYDIAALQYLYGANFNTNNGDSVYTFSQTTGEMFVNGVGQGAPSDNKIFLTIWDGGGNDTIDASNYANGVTIDLRPGEFSTVDPAQLVNSLAFQNLVSLAPGNIAMSLLYNNDARSLIENATGGTGNDIFVGNIANNVLDGGAGSDSVIFTSTTSVNVTLNDTNTDVIVTHDGETDTLRSIENIGGTSGSDTITGNSQDNLLTGGSGGTDVLTGNDGNDRLVGGGFTVTTNFLPGSPPSQPDITKPGATNNGSIGTAVNTAGFYDIDANPNIANATTIPHATINATATGGTIEYYRIDVTAAGAQAIFDIDGTGSLTDAIIELVDSAGNLLATNDTGPGDPGTTVNDDAYITYTFAAPGTYYIRVGRFISNSIAQPMLAGQTYTLHISLQGAAGATTFTLNNTSSLVADGGEGNDYLQGTVADDTLTGGNGNDTASFATAYNGGGAGTTGVTVDLNLQGAAQNTEAAGLDTLSGIENLVGSQYNDTLTGDGGDNFIEGGLGTDILVGGGGNDTASYAGAAGGVTVSLGLQGSAQSTGNAGTDTLSGFTNLAGSSFNDSLTGDANANTISGGAGNDTLNPGANASGTVDLLDGGLGTDTASFAGYASGVTATLNGALDGAATAGGAIATLRSIENLTGSANADTLTGDANDNAIEGGLGDDTLTGGLGVDTLVFTGSTAVTVNLATLTAQATGWGSDTITGFENVRTGSGADNITGDGNDNIFFEGGGNDTYNGAGGIDTVDYSAVTGGVGVNLATLTAQNTTNAGTDTITNIENVVGSATGGNVLQGNASGNRLTGGAAADTLLGNLGIDFLFGGAGNDILIGGQNGALDDGTADTLEGGAGNDFLGGGQGNDIVRGGDGDDVLVGGIVNNSQQFFTNDGGDDTYEGGNGSDRAIVVLGDRLGVGASTVGVAFDIGNIAGNSAITFNGVNVGSMTSIEFVTFRGSSVNDVVKGGGSLDSLLGLGGDDTLDGWIGNDILEGGLGNDTLIGGEGLDTASYSTATAGVTVDLRIVGAQNTVGAGTDTLSDIEYLTASGFGDTLHGSDVFNLIVDSVVSGAAGQTDSIFGYGGNDSILVTRAAAAVATNINMDGGDGDDFIELRGGTLSAALAVNAAGLVAASNGASQTYMALGTTSNDRNLDVVTVDGGAGNDRIVLSGVASATVNAGSGADIVSISMRGATSVNNYQLTLGAGADIVQLGGTSAEVATTARTNRVTDFDRGNTGDKFEWTAYLNGGLTGYTANSNAFASGHLRLTQSGSDLLVQIDRDAGGGVNSFVTIFAISNGYTGGFTAFNFDGFIGNLTLTGIGALDETITGATGNDVLSGGDGNDVLNGLDGTDTLNGGNGTDTLNGGNGNDTLYGGAGNDNLNGDAGTDTANYDGVRSDYTVTAIVVNGVVTGYTVTDNVPAGGDEGTDTLNSVESLQFSNMSMSLTGSVLLYDTTNTLVGAFTTIQAAIDAASNGYRVFVSAGTYTENPNVNKDITIEGPNAGIAGNGVRGAEAIVNGLFSIVADGVTLDGLKITGAPLFGQDITGVFVNNDNATLTNLILDGPSNGYGIQTTYNGGVTGLILSNSLVTDWGAGAYFNPTTGFTATGNSFTGNGNDILGDGWVAGSFIDNNSFNNSVGSHIGYGTYLSVEDMRTIVGTNNTFTGTGSRAVGIFAYGDGTPGGQDVTGTEYADGFFGNEFVAGSGNDSTFHGLGGNDSMYGGAGNDTFDGGSGTDTSSYDGIATFGETGTGFTVTTGTEGTDTLENVEIVDDSNSGVIRLVGHGGYATIQAAIDAANDGDTIVVASGTWTENLNVNKDVTILGVNNYGVDGNAARGAESVIDGQIIVTAAGATIDGFKLIGDQAGSYGNTAVEVQANNFTLANNIMDGDGDVAILVFAGTTGLDVGHNRIEGYSIGVYVSASTTGSIHDNRFQGDGGPISGLGNGINTESSGVAIANNAFDGIYSGTLNIALFGPDTVDLLSFITGNTITNTPVARPVQIMPTNLTHNILGTDFNEAFDGETAAGTYGVLGAFSFDGRGGNDHAWGGEQGDTLTGGTGNDELYGNGGGDTLNGGDDSDLLVGGAGNDILNGGIGIDTLNGGDDNDSLNGGDDADTLHGDAGADTADGGNGNDTVFGDAGNDILAGGAGIDTLNGGEDDDNLDGGSGNDTLNGDNGNDTLHGGAGNDNLNGGAGTDTAVYDGHRGDYSIGMITGAGGRIVGFSSVSDNEPTNGNEGSDTLTSIERVQFTNRTLDVTLPVQLFDQTNQLVGTFTTIQAAIDSAQDNYTIRVAAGIFDEDLIINVGVRILGARTTAVTGRDAAGGVGETTIIGHAKVTAEDNVTLTGLRFVNDGTTTGGGASDPTLQFLTGGGATGHLVSNSIFWSTVAGGAAGVDDRAISSGSIPDGLLSFTGNLISGSQQGLTVTASWGQGIALGGGGTSLSASGNIIEWTRTGLVLDGAGGSLAIVDNNILRNLGTAFSVLTTEDVLAASGNDFQNVGDEFSFANVTEDVTFAAFGTFDTLVPVGDSNDLIVIRGGTGNDLLTGTALDDLIDGNGSTANPTAADNDILNGGAGNDTLLGRYGNDSLRGGSGDDIMDGGAGIDTALVGSGATFVANGTNWTVTSSQGVDTLISIERVDVGPGPGPDVLLVGSGGFATIQAAVDAANDGDIILIAAGTYVEQVVVNDRDNLTIRAADGAQVTIQAPADLVETARSISGREINAVFTVKDSANVFLVGIDIDGNGAGNTVDENDGPGQANFYGVFYRSSSGGLTDVDVAHVRDSVLSGAQRGVGVGTDNPTPLPFSMTGGSITDFQKNATVFNGADLTVTGVTIIGAGATGAVAQNGIQVTNSTGTISGNTISGLGYTGGGTLATGILGFGNTNLNITGNTITGANNGNTAAQVAGIYILDFGTPNSGGSISGNTITYVDRGIVVRGDLTPTGIVIENNDISNIDGTDPDAAGVDFQPDPAFATAYDVDGSAGDDVLSGGAGDDSLSGLGGDDLLTGNGGNDTLDGDGDTDTAAYAGVRSGYDIVAVTDSNGLVIGYSSVTDTDAGNGDEGADTLISVERLSFGDVTLDLGQPVQLFDDGGILVGTFATIQAAVDAASDDYTIRLAAGSYVENVDVDKDVTILGPNHGVDGTGTRGAEAVIDGQVTISAAGVTIDGVEIVGDSAGSLGDTAVEVKANDFTLTNSVLDGSGDTAIFIGLVSGVEVSHNLIQGYSIGAYVSGGDTSGSIHDNRFQGDGGPLTGLGNGVNSESSHVDIADNIFDGIYAGSLNIFPFGPDTVDLQDYITGNTITDSGVDRPVQILPTNATHNILGTDFNEAFDGETAAGSYGVTGAFSFDGRGGDDRAWGGEQGDSLTGGSGDDQLFGNGGGDTLNGGADDDLLTGGSGDDTLNGDGGEDIAIYSGSRSGYDVTGATDASGRLTSFTAVDDTDAGNGDEGSDTLSGVEKLQFGDVTLDLAAPVQLFDGSDQLIGTFDTIQAAIDAAANGDTIIVASGTYSETLNVNKDVSIFGANRGVDGTAARGAETVIDGQITINAAGATIDGVKLVGAAAGSLGTTAVEVKANDFTLANSVLDGTGDTAIITGSVTGLDVGHNLITGYSIGIYVSGGNTSGSIHDNRFQGDGGPATGLGNGVNSESSHVDIADNVFDGIYAGSLNLFPSGPDSVDLLDYISGNTITNSGAARPVQILPTNGTHNILGTDFNEAFDGETAAGSYGVTGAFSFDGRGGEDRAWGGEQGDTLAGGSGNDMLFGNGGNDTLRGDAGNDALEGGSGIDTAAYAGAATITQTVSGWTVLDAGGTDTLSNVEIVDDNASGKTLLVGNGGYATIQAAIDAAADGDTILVASGTYVETLNVNKDVTILGANHGVAGTGVRGAESVIDGQITINAAGASIDGFKLVGAASGSLGTTAVEVKANDFSLSNSVLDGSGDTAIITGSVTGLDVHHNLIQGYSIGIYVSGGDTSGSIHDNRFQGDGGPATGLGNGVNSESSHVAISQNVFDGIYAGSLNLFPFGPNSVDLNSYITGNTITDSGAARPVQILPTNATHNFIGTDFNEAFDGETAAGSYGVTGAFSFDGRGGDDKAWGGEQGDTFAGGSGTDELNGNGGDDTLTGGLGNDALNGGAGFDTATYAGPINDYTITYTTDSSGRVTGISSVVDNVAAGGDEGSDTLTSIEKLTFSDAHVDLNDPVQLFDGGNVLVGTFATIQAAVDAASAGYKILLAAGTYAENVNINKDVTILGPNQGVDGTGTRGAEAVINGLVTISAAGVTIDGVRSIGNVPGSLGNTGIEVLANNFTLTNSVLNGTGNTALSIAASVSGLDVSHNLFGGYAIGIYVNGGTTSGSIHDNRFQGDGGPMTGLGNGVDSESSHVQITGNVFDGIYAASIAVSPFGPDPVDIDTFVTLNTITNSGVVRPVLIIPTSDSLDITGTDLAETFDGVAGQASYGAAGLAFTFDGQGGNDQAIGGDQGDSLTGGEGNDQLFGNGGDDELFGGAGSDQLRAGTGSDHLDGGTENDVLYFGANLSAGDVADGGAGRDAIVLQGNVTVVLSDTNIVNIESISLQSGANATFGDTANNFYDFDVTTADGNVLAGQQLIVNAQSLRAGEDFTFDGSAETDGKFLVYGGHGVDNLTGGDGVDVFFFEGQRWGADDFVDGGAGRDALVISAGSGITHIEFAADSFVNIESISLNNHFATDPSQKPSYEIVLDNGNVAPGGTLIVNGSSIAGADQFVDIDGSAVQDGNLILFSGAGSDVLIGGAGADILFAAGEADSLTGGGGADIFRYDSTSDSTAATMDEILDLQSGTDKIDLSRIDANTIAGGDQAFTWIGSSAFTGGGAASAGELRAFLSGSDWIVEGDTNGDGVADLVISVTTQGGAPLVQGDFLP